MKEDRNKEEAKLDKLIRESLSFEKSPEDFTDKIMQRIETTDQQVEMALSSAMHKYTIESPSPGFTDAVMARLETTPSINVNPVIIGKKAWIFIIAALTAFVIYVIASGTKGEASPETGLYGDFMSRLGERFGQIGGSVSFQLPEILSNPVFAISLFALSSMLLVDYVLKSRRLSVIQ